jgi:hypothetical protein
MCGYPAVAVLDIVVGPGDGHVVFGPVLTISVDLDRSAGNQVQLGDHPALLAIGETVTPSVPCTTNGVWS